MNFVKFFKSMALWLFLLCLIPASAQPVVGAVYKESLSLGSGRRLALPDGAWQATHVTSMARKDFTWAINIFKNQQMDASIPYLVIRHTNQNANWAATPCHTYYEAPFLVNDHGTKANEFITKCSRFLDIGDFRAWWQKVENWKNQEDKAWWGNVVPGFFGDQREWSRGMLFAELTVQKFKGLSLRVDAFIVPPKAFTSVQLSDNFKSGKPGPEHEMLSNWAQSMIGSMEAGFFLKEIKPVLALNYPIGSVELNPFAVTQLPKIDIEKGEKTSATMPASSPRLPTPEAIRLAEEKRVSDERRVAEEARLSEEKRVVAEQKRRKEEQERLAAEAKQKEQLRLAAEARAKEELRVAEQRRLAEEARLAEEKRVAAEEKRRKEEQERLAAEAKQKEQLRLAAEARAKEELRVAEQIRLAEEARLAEEKRVAAEQKRRKEEQERLVAEAKQKDQLRLAAEARAKEEQGMAEAKRLADEKRLKAEQDRAKEQLRLAEEDRFNLEKKAREQALENQRLLAEVARLQAEAEKNRGKPEPISNRKALVIGNNKYKFVSTLATASEDAKTIAGNLESVGYKVTLKLDASEREMRAAIRSFASQVEGGDEVAFYFAGHGVQIGSANYLIPVDVNGESEAQIRDEAVALQRVLDDMTERKAKFTLAVIDACRDNPFKVAGRNVGSGLRGLAPTNAATGQMVIFSAGAGQKALDSLGPSDKNKNGVFTRVFVKQMQKQAVPIDKILKDTRTEVVNLAKTIGHEQVPAIYDQVIGEFFFKR
jgi:hypothetical protein